MEINSLLIENEIGDVTEGLIDLLDSRFELFSRKKIRFYKFSVGDYSEVTAFKKSFPIFLTELGTCFALDVSSLNVSRLIYELNNENLEKKVFKVRLNNIDSEIRHAVSYGNIKEYSKEIPQRLLRLYHESMSNVISITPSICFNGVILSPNRWFILENQIGIEKNRTLVCFNSGLVFLSETDLYHREPNNKINGIARGDLYKTHAFFVRITKEGHQDFSKINLNFIEDPRKLNILSRDEKGYFLCQFYSFINLETGDSENLVTYIKETFLSIYDIAPFLFPWIITESELSKPIIEFNIDFSIFASLKNAMLKNINGFNKIGNLVDIDRLSQDYSHSIRIEKVGEKSKVLIINPFLAPYLIKQAIYEKKNIDKSKFYSLFNNEDLFDSLADLTSSHFDLLRENDGLVVYINGFFDEAVDILKEFIH